jgi:hypothetical protein
VLHSGDISIFRQHRLAQQLGAELKIEIVDGITKTIEAHSSKHTLQSPVPIVEGGRVIRHDVLPAVPVAGAQLVVGDLSFTQGQSNSRFGTVGVGPGARMVPIRLVQSSAGPPFVQDLVRISEQ